MCRRVSQVLLVFLALAIAAPEIPVLTHIAGIESAHAQTKRKRKTLFDLFKSRRNKKKRTKKNRPLLIFNRDGDGHYDFNRKKRRTRKKEVVKRSVQKKKIIQVVKNENADKILVIGDFIATSLYNGLKTRQRQNPNIVIVNKTEDGLGLAKKADLDLPQKITQLIEETKPAARLCLAPSLADGFGQEGY